MFIFAEADSTPIALPKEFFTAQSMLTLGTATAMTLVAAYTIQWTAGREIRWTPVFFAQIISYLGTYMTQGQIIDYVVAFFNGCLIFCSAIGIGNIVSGVSKRSTGKISNFRAGGTDSNAFFPLWW